MTRWIELGSSDRSPPFVGAAARAVAETAADPRRAGRPIGKAGGHACALLTVIASEQDRGTDFLCLANALSALYSRASREMRPLDAMLLAVPR